MTSTTLRVALGGTGVQLPLRRPTQPFDTRLATRGIGIVSRAAGTSATPPTSPSRSSLPPPATTMETSQTLTLPSGRTLGYATYGPPGGYPVMFLHGLPSCRLELVGAAASLDLPRLGVRLIAPDRPGFGLSTFTPHTVLDYVEDIAALAAHLGVSRRAGSSDVAGAGGEAGAGAEVDGSFAVIGGSGGAPFALACAWAADQGHAGLASLGQVGLFAGAPPFRPPVPSSNPVRAQQEERELAQWWPRLSRLILHIASTYPALSSAIADRIIQFGRWLDSTSYGRRSGDAYYAKFIRDNAPDKGQGASAGAGAGAGAEMSDAEASREVDNVKALVSETFRQGTDGWLHNIRLVGAPWGFAPEEVRRTVRIWHGTKDASAPIEAMRWLCQRLGDGRMEEVQGANHFQVERAFEGALVAMRAGTGEGKVRR